MPSIKTALLLSTALVIAGNSAQALELRYETPQRSAPAMQANVGTIALGALALGTAVAVIGNMNKGGGDDGDEDSEKEEAAEDASDPDTSDPSDLFRTAEYSRNWGLENINVISRYEAGATGQGAIGAIFDSGADLSHSELADRVIYSYSYFDGTDDVTDEVGHGTAVLATAGANKDDTGMHGVAYDADFLVFQGIGDSLIMDPISAWADATIQSAEMGASVINHSWAFVDDNSETITIGDYSSRSQLLSAFGTDIFDALDVAVENDLISVFAAGNSGLSDVAVNGGIPVYFPEYEDYFLVAVAIDENDQIASFSNRCGLAAEFCIAAPGVDIYTAAAGGGYTTMDGTSFAAPYVTGAALVLASSFPELTAPEITQILKDTARDLGTPGVDEIYGVGALDLENAVAPQGTLSLQTSSTLNERSYAVDRSHVSTSGGMAAALSASFAKTSVMVTDRYDRGYSASMDAFVGSGADILRDRDELQAYTSGRPMASALAGGTTRLSYAPTSLQAVTGATADVNFAAPYANLVENPASFSLENDFGAGSVRITHAYSASGSLSDGSYLSAEGKANFGGSAITLGLGHLAEDGAFIGTDVTGAFGENLSASTDFVSLRGDLSVGDQQVISLAGSFGKTDFSGDGMLKDGSDIKTSSVGIGYSRSDAFRANDKLTISATRNLNVSGGDMTIKTPSSLGVASQGVRSSDVKMQTASIDMEKTTAPVDLKIGYETEIFGGRIAIGAAIRDGDARHRVGSIGYRVAF